jgi:cytochrome b
MTLNSSTEKQIWDPLVRIFHWSLVFFFALAYITEDDFLSLHTWAGYAIIGLLVFRLLWGIIGTRYARFSQFVHTPTYTKTYMLSMLTGQSKRYLGHNPAGAWMIIALIFSLAATTSLGIATLATQGEGPWAATFVANWPDDWLEELHEFFANFTLLLMFVHLLGVALSSVIHSENLMRSMITGRKATRTDDID